MSDVASLELCKELYELSGWNDTFWTYARYPKTKGGENTSIVKNKKFDKGSKTIYVPAYTLGYLLDKLVEVKTGLTIYHVHSTMSWEAFYAGKFFEYGVETQHWETQGGMNPADAACKLAIELFKQGVLK